MRVTELTSGGSGLPWMRICAPISSSSRPCGVMTIGTSRIECGSITPCKEAEWTHKTHRVQETSLDSWLAGLFWAIFSVNRNSSRKKTRSYFAKEAWLRLLT